MKTYFLTTKTNNIDLVNKIIKSEDLEATVTIERDAYNQAWITIEADEEDYTTLKSIYNMVA